MEIAKAANKQTKQEHRRNALELKNLDFKTEFMQNSICAVRSIIKTNKFLAKPFLLIRNKKVANKYKKKQNLSIAESVFINEIAMRD